MNLVYPLAFPVTPTDALRRVVFADAGDTQRINIDVSGTCTSMKFVQPVGKTPQLRFIASGLDVPLLLRVPAELHRLKLHMQLPTLDSDEALVILKTWGSDDEAELLKEYLQSNVYDDRAREVSKISKAKLQSLGSLDLIVNDVFDTVSGGMLNISVWEQGSTPRQLFMFRVWVDSLKEAPPAPEKPNSVFRILDFRKAFTFATEDGPQFRKSLERYEGDLPVLKKALVLLQEDLSLLESLLRRLLHCKHSLLNSLKLLLGNHFSSLVKHLHAFRHLRRNVGHLFDTVEHALRFQLEVTNPKDVAKMLTYFQNVAEGEVSPNRKAFERTSKEFYDWMHKYLLNEKDRPELKLLTKRKAFELAKFDYLNSLNLASNNQYFNEFLEKILRFSNLTQHSDYQLGRLSPDAELYLNAISRFNSEKMQLRQMIEACRSNEELTHIVKVNSLNPASAGDGSPIAHAAAATALDEVFASPQSANFEDVAHRGILYTLGGQGKGGWHKEWVVLQHGQLTEYSDWRKGRLPINNPIDLALASVKPITHDKRQFCFEIITSNRGKHTFQAMTENDRSQWMKALYNAGQDTRKLLPLRQKTIRDVKRLTLPVSVSILNEEPDLVRMVRNIEAENEKCVDCGSTDAVEWVSMTFLVVFCVHCASCHRNLGSHISKVKLLRMDIFENESRVLLAYVSNKGLRYLGGTTAATSHEERLAFIRKKYAEKAFLKLQGDQTQLLIDAVRSIDIRGMIRALVCGADPNIKVRTAGQNSISLVEYSLGKVVEATEGGATVEYFVAAEVLLLYGCNATRVSDAVGAEALAYWLEKRQ